MKRMQNHVQSKPSYNEVAGILVLPILKNRSHLQNTAIFLLICAECINERYFVYKVLAD